MNLTAKSPPVPAMRKETIRQSIKRYLVEGPCTIPELATLVGVKERDILAHLEHLDRTLRRLSERLIIVPAVCSDCGFRFSKRKRLSRPSGCPRCRSHRIDHPIFSISGGNSNSINA